MIRMPTETRLNRQSDCCDVGYAGQLEGVSTPFLFAEICSVGIVPTVANTSSTSSSLIFVQGHRWYIRSPSAMTALPNAIPAPMMIAGPWSLPLILSVVEGADGLTVLVGSADEVIDGAIE